MKTYTGVRSSAGCLVTVNGRTLPPRLRPHGLAGFDWGRDGDAAAELALSILSDVVGHEQARDLYQNYQRAVINALPHLKWSLTEEDVRLQVAGLHYMVAADSPASRR